MRTPRYQVIADHLQERIVAGDYAPGRLLPSEAGLSEEFAASRVTVRRALEGLRERGLVTSRQGLGWFVAGEPVHQALDALDTLERQMTAAGVEPARQVLDFAFIDAPPRVAALLGESRVLEVRRLNLADGQPFARVTVWCPERYGSSLSRDAVEAEPFYDLLERDAGVKLGGANQTIGAASASKIDAELLDIAENSPVLVCERLTRSADGTVVLLSEHVYPGHLTAFTVDLPSAGRSETPAGLRLVE